jgi:hypothetical protein
MNDLFYAAFHDELIKLSSATTDTAKAAGPALKLKVPLKPLAHMAAGAAGLYGAQQVYKDWKQGREIRKMQNTQGGY